MSQYSGIFWGIDPTGKTINVTQMNIIRFADGKMIEAWEDYDEYGMRLQLGMELKVKETNKSSINRVAEEYAAFAPLWP
jgi:hypothetical protein